MVVNFWVLEHVEKSEILVLKFFFTIGDPAIGYCSDRCVIALVPEFVVVGLTS